MNKINEWNRREDMPQDVAELMETLAGGPYKRPQLAKDMRRSYWEIARWVRLNYIPNKAWDDIMRMAKTIGLEGVNVDYLHTLNAKRRQQ